VRWIAGRQLFGGGIWEGEAVKSPFRIELPAMGNLAGNLFQDNRNTYREKFLTFSACGRIITLN
jgi:hypothetical protein